MKKIIGITVAALAAVALAGGIMAVNASSENSTNNESLELAQAPSTAAVAEPGNEAVSETTTEADSAESEEVPLERDVNEAPEITQVSGQLISSEGEPVSGGVIYFVFPGTAE